MLSLAFAAILPLVSAIPAPAPNTAATSLTSCLSSRGVPAKSPSTSNFAEWAQPYNLRLQYTPAAIAIPTTTKHISDAVICASQNGVKVQAKSGGHSYASFSSGGADGTLIVDLKAFQNITVGSDNVAAVGAGVRLGNLAQGIYDQAKRALPHGTCPGVGIGGHFTHGGYGYDSRAWGLAMDTISGLDVVLADGSFVHATQSAYPDVYYALRGAADSFGIVTTFYLKTQAAPSSIINFSYSIPGMFSSKTQSAKYFKHIQNFATNASVVDRKLGFGMYMDGQGFSISGTYMGASDTFKKNIAPEFLRGLPSPSDSSVQTVDWVTSLQMLGGVQSLKEPTDRTGYTAHDNFFAKSVTVPEATPLTTAALESYFDYIITQGVSNAPSPWYSIINLYGGPDSQINNKDASFAAYSDRSALWVAQHVIFASTDAPLPAAAIPWLNGLNDAMTGAMPSAPFGAYLNYVDPSLSAAQAHKLYYGDDLYARLLAIKTTVDPNDVFSNPQTIGK